MNSSRRHIISVPSCSCSSFSFIAISGSVPGITSLPLGRYISQACFTRNFGHILRTGSLTGLTSISSLAAFYKSRFQFTHQQLQKLHCLSILSGRPVSICSCAFSVLIFIAYPAILSPFVRCHHKIQRKATVNWYSILLQ